MRCDSPSRVREGSKSGLRYAQAEEHFQAKYLIKGVSYPGRSSEHGWVSP